jgi:hypothetical protein
VIGALVFFIIAWIASGLFAGVLLRALQRTQVEATIAKFLATLLRWSLIALSTVACLGMFGVNITAFAAVFGAVGLAIGLALQGSLSNLAAGVMLLLFRPFKVGDAISVAGQAGIVDEIELFSTRLDTPDNRRIIIPNASAFNAIVEKLPPTPAKYNKVCAACSGRLAVPNTSKAIFSFHRCGLASRAKGVSVMPGFKPFTVMPWAPKLKARLLVRAIMPPLEAA